MGSTGIDYVTKSWNIVHGCDWVTEGCDHCWARGMAARLRGRNGYPLDKNGFAVTIRPDRLLEPLGWKDPERVAVGFMGDLFHPRVPREFIFRVLDIAVQAHLERGHTFLFLTKRVRRMRHLVTAYIERGHVCGAGPFCREQHGGQVCPLPDGLLFGCSVESERYAWRIGELLRVPAARWLSLEPLLGLVDLDRWFGLQPGRNWAECLCAEIHPSDLPCMVCEGRRDLGWLSGIRFVAVGGESGPKARPTHPDAFRRVRDACVPAGVPFYFKQHGEWVPFGSECGGPDRYSPDKPNYTPEQQAERSAKEWANGRPYQFVPGLGGAATMIRVGKAKAGALLDGREHRELPRAGVAACAD